MECHEEDEGRFIIFTRQSREEGKLLQIASSGKSCDGPSLRSLNAEIYCKALLLAARNNQRNSVRLILSHFDTHQELLSKESDRRRQRSRLIFLIWHGLSGMISSAPFYTAVKEGNLDAVESLVNYCVRDSHNWKEFVVMHSKSPDPYSRKTLQALDCFQQLLQWAVRWGHASIVSHLVPEYQRLFDPNVDVLGLTLHLAAYHNHLDVLEMILTLTCSHEQRKLDPPAPQEVLFQPAMSTIFSEDESLLDLSLPRAGDDHSRSMLARAVDHSLPSSCRSSFREENYSWPPPPPRPRPLPPRPPMHQQALQVVQEAAIPQVALSLSKDGLTALHLAAQTGCLGAIELLHNTAMLDASEVSVPELFTPLHLAASFGHVEVLNFLITIRPVTALTPNYVVKERGSHIDVIMARDCLGRTALHYAAREGHANVVQALVNVDKCIADVADYDGLLALHMAARAGHVEVIRILKPFGGICCKARHSVEVKRWVEQEFREGSCTEQTSLTFYPGKDWKFPRLKLFDSLFWSTDGFTPLHFAARYGCEAAVEELLKETNQLEGDPFFMQDSRGLLAYDWMHVQGLGDAFLRYAIAGGRDLRLLNEKLERRSFNKKNIGVRSMGSASDIAKEKEAMKELQEAWQNGYGIGHIGMPILHWLLEDEEVECAWQLPSTIKPVALWAFNQALEKANFNAAKEILLQADGALDSLSLDAVHVSNRVKETVRGLKLEDESSQFKRALEDFLIVLVTRVELVGCARWLARWAKQNALKSLLGVIMDRPELRQGLYEDRQRYVECANALLVGAALIAGVAFQGWLQPPLGYSYEYEGTGYADVHERAVRSFWWLNNGAFFWAVATFIAAAKGAVPVTIAMDTVRAAEKARRAVAMASLFLGLALVCMVGAFASAGSAVLPPFASDLHIMQTSVVWGTTICGLALLWFYVGVLPLLLETMRYIASSLADLIRSLVTCAFFSPYLLLRKCLGRWRFHLPAAKPPETWSGIRTYLAAAAQSPPSQFRRSRT